MRLNVNFFSAFVSKLWPKTTYKMFDDIKRTNTSVSLSVKAELRLSLHRVFNLQGKAVIEFDILSFI